MSKEALPRVALVGDSDISRWPAQLLPSAPACSPSSKPIVKGRPGATLDELAPMVDSALADIPNSPNNDHVIILVLCAGENDLGQGYSIGKAISSFETAIDACFVRRQSKVNVIFLGPKFEPWLIGDHTARKQYLKLSKGMRRAAERHGHSARITYVDCLTMFCGDSADVPGALTSKAVPERKYFHDDGLHLSNEGYEIWKGIVESEMLKCVDEPIIHVCADIIHPLSHGSIA